MLQKNKKLLLITGKDDVHADYVIDKINQLGKSEDIIRFHPEDALTNLTVEFTQNDLHIRIKDSNRDFKVTDIGCVWYRKPEEILIPDHFDEMSKIFVKGQIETALQGLYYASADHALWINPRSTAYIARNKIKQLWLAKKLGFTVPDSIITNNSQLAYDFVHSHRLVCTKDVDTAYNAHYAPKYPMHTIAIDREEFKLNADLIALCPTLFQEFIEKDFDLRVIVLRERIFAVAIYSQEHDAAKADFRMVAPILLRHEAFEIPSDLQQKILSFMQNYDVVYSAFDFAVTKDRKFYFLENNPNGQWLWLEELAHVPISAAFLDLFAEQLRW